jgi:hypothetical protein
MNTFLAFQKKKDFQYIPSLSLKFETNIEKSSINLIQASGVGMILIWWAYD